MTKNLRESEVMQYTEGAKDFGLMVQVQETTSIPLVAICKMYTNDAGETWGFCSPRVSGAVQYRGKLSSKQLGWLISELQAAKAIIDKAEKAVEKTATTTTKKTSTKKAEDAPVKRKTAKLEDVEIALESKLVNRKSVRI